MGSYCVICGSSIFTSRFLIVCGSQLKFVLYGGVVLNDIHPFQSWSIKDDSSEPLL